MAVLLKMTNRQKLGGGRFSCKTGSRIKASVIALIMLTLSTFHHETAFAQTEELSVAYCVDCVPFHYQDENGKPAGLIIDYWHAWSEKTGIKVKFIPAPWDETLKMVGSGAVDSHAGLFFNKERDKYLDYGVALRKTDTHVFFHRGLSTTTNFSELAAYRIGVIKGDFVEGFLKEKVPSGFIVGYPDYESIIEDLKTGVLKVFAADTPTGLFHLKKAGLLADYTFVSSGPLYRNDWYVASKEGNSATIKLINDGMALVTEEQKTKIARRWNGNTRDASKDDALIIAIDRSYPPFTFMNAQGQPAGLFVDLWKVWSEKSGRKIRFRPSNWSETLESLRAGEVDIHSGLSYSDDRAAWMDFSQQIYQTASRIYHRNGDVVPADLGAFGNRTLAVWGGTFQEAEVRRLYPNTNIKSYLTTMSMVNALLRGEVDALIQEDLVMETIIRDLGLQGAIIARPERLFVSTIHAGMAKGKSDDLKNINASMELIADFEKENIEARWIPNRDNRFFGNGMTDAKVGLTRQERAWLNNHALIRLGSDRAWAPYEFLDKDGVLQGVSAAFLARVQRILGIAFQPPESLPWKDTMERAKNGKIDVLSAVAKTPERQKFFKFTKPYLIWPNVIAARTDAHEISGLEDLLEKRVGVVEGYAIQSTLKHNNPKLKLVPHTDIAEGLKALSAGQIDAFVGSPITIEHFTNQLNLTNIAVVAKTPYKLELSFAVRKDWPELEKVLDKALAQITTSERRALAKSVGLSVDVTITKLETTAKELLTTNEIAALTIIAIALLIFIMIFVWLIRTQRRPFFQSLRGKSILFIVGVFVLVGGSTLWAMSFVGDRIAVQLGNFVAERHVLWHKEKVLGAVQRELALSKQMAESELLVRWARQEDDPIIAADARNELQHFHDNFKARTFFVGLKKSGHFFYSDEKVKKVFLKVIDTLSPTDQDDIWFFATMKDAAPYNLNVDHNVQLGVTNLWVNYAMRKNGETYGVVGTGIHLTEFIKAFIESNTQGVTAIMIDGTGSYRAHTDEEKIAQNKLASESDAKSTENGIWSSLQNDAEHKLLRRHMEKLKDGDGEAATFFLNIDGVRSLVAISYLAPLDWYTLAIFEPDSMVGLEEMGTLAGVLGIALLITVFVFVFGQNLLIIRPLRELMLGTSKVAEGDYDVKLSITQQDEVGDLARTFNGMASTIADYTRNLELKVEERTAELSESQALFKTVIDNMPAVVFLKKPDGTFQLVNRRYEELYDLKTEDIRGKTLYDLYPKEQADLFTSFDQENLNGGKGGEREQILEKDGKEIILNNVMFPVFDENGDMTYYGGIEVDITELKKAEVALRENEAKIRRIFDTANEGIWIIDKEAITEEANDAMCDMLGRNREDVVGKHIFEFVNEKNKQIFLDQIERRKQGEEGAYEIALSKPDDSLIPCLFNAVPRYDGEGEKIGSVAMVTDITDRKAAEQAIKVKEEQLRLAMDNMPGGMFLVDRDQNFVLFNRQYSELFDFPDDLIAEDRPLIDMIHFQAQRGDYGSGRFVKIVNEMMKIFESDQHHNYERRLQNGRILELNLAPTPDGGMVAVATNITERKEAELKLKDAFDVISSSIDYASRIQRSVLPDDSLFSALLSEHMVLWEPRDVVGGDIYWCRMWGDGILIILGDCTGHGVPGAFMTLIATGALDNALTDVSNGQVANLLQRIHQLVQVTLGQHGVSGESDDGMELGLCYLRPDMNELVFAGARFELFIVENDDVSIIKGTKSGIGYRGISHTQEYEEHRIRDLDGKAFFMTSDGLIDQVGGEKRRMFGKKRFKSLLLDIQNKTMAEQKEIIYQALLDYQGDERRRDDVSVAGFKV